MSLFGDLPALGSADDGTGPAPVPHSILKKPAIAPPPSILRSKKRKVEETSTAANASTRNAGHGLFAPFGPIEDEYDPAVPNEYEKAKQAQEEAVLEADRAARLAAQQKESGAQLDAAAGPNDEFEPRAGLGASSAGLGGGGIGSGKASGNLSVAEKLMKGMGWSEGEGLGKEKQGISTPFILQKTDTRTGVIVNAQPINGPQNSTQGAAQNVGMPTKIVLLKNMVGPGEVDEGLEDEVAEEVSKFGEVFRVLIFEVSGVPVAPHQAVRIFVEMDKIQSAQQAVAALNGRYFDQKIISASFFDEARFEAMDLAPSPDELQ